MLYICKNSLIIIFVFNLSRKSSVCSLNLNIYLLITMLISLNETVSSQMSFTANAVSFTLIMFFYIFSQIESLTTQYILKKLRYQFLLNIYYSHH